MIAAAGLLVVAGFGCGVAVAGWALARHLDEPLSYLLCRDCTRIGAAIVSLAFLALVVLSIEGVSLAFP